MRLFSYDKPKIKVQTTKTDGFSGWLKCTHCHEMIHANELAQNCNCCPKCSYHYRLSVSERIAALVDEGSWHPLFEDLVSVDMLSFVDTESYKDRLQKARQKSGEQSEGVVVGFGKIEENPVALGIMDFSFMAGSMGSVVGEKLTLLMEGALSHCVPLVIVCSSGGARMQESVFSLMQMAKTSAALAKLNAACVPYISILTNPTSGGVTASFASLGDIIIAEPNALICFAGPRVVSQVVGEELPEGAQKSEFLLERGMIDRIVPRKELRKTLAVLLRYLSPVSPKPAKNVDVLSDKIKEFFLLTDEKE